MKWRNSTKSIDNWIFEIGMKRKCISIYEHIFDEVIVISYCARFLFIHASPNRVTNNRYIANTFFSHRFVLCFKIGLSRNALSAALSAGYCWWPRVLLSPARWEHEQHSGYWVTDNTETRSVTTMFIVYRSINLSTPWLKLHISCKIFRPTQPVYI